MRERRFAFVLRLWFEYGDENDAPLVRGSLQAAESDQARYFTALDDLPDLVRELTGWRSAMLANSADIDTD